MKMNKEIKTQLNNFPEELVDLAFDILEEVSRNKKSKKEIERFVLNELDEIMDGGE